MIKNVILGLGLELLVKTKLSERRERVRNLLFWNGKKSEGKSQEQLCWCEQGKDVLLFPWRLHPWVKGCLVCYSQSKCQLEMSYVTLSPETVLENESILSYKA